MFFFYVRILKIIVIRRAITEYSLLNAEREFTPERSVPLNHGDHPGSGIFFSGKTIYFINTKRGWRRVV
jgi:hypothetical protein